MKRPFVLALLAATILPTAAQATLFIYSAPLLGSTQNPPVVTTGTGSTTVTYDDAAHTLRIAATFSDLLGTVTASHIHIGSGPGTNGPVATTVPSFIGFPLGVTAGAYDATFSLTDALIYNPAFVTSSGGTIAGAETALVTGLAAGLGYLNIHTTLAPGGEIRGDLAGAAAAIPEPASWAMMIAGFGLLGGAMRRRRVVLHFA